MSRRDDAWLTDIVHAVDVIHEYVTEGSLVDGLTYDACRARLIEIGEAVKNIDRNLLLKAPTIHWQEIARMRDQLAHHYFDTDHAVVTYVIQEELTPLRVAAVMLLEEAASITDAPEGEFPTPEL